MTDTNPTADDIGSRLCDALGRDLTAAEAQEISRSSRLLGVRGNPVANALMASMVIERWKHVEASARFEGAVTEGIMAFKEAAIAAEDAAADRLSAMVAERIDARRLTLHVIGASAVGVGLMALVAWFMIGEVERRAEARLETATTAATAAISRSAERAAAVLSQQAADIAGRAVYTAMRATGSSGATDTNTAYALAAPLVASTVADLPEELRPRFARLLVELATTLSASQAHAGSSQTNRLNLLLRIAEAPEAYLSSLVDAMSNGANFRCTSDRFGVSPDKAKSR